LKDTEAPPCLFFLGSEKVIFDAEILQTFTVAGAAISSVVMCHSSCETPPDPFYHDIFVSVSNKRNEVPCIPK
jgi:hypothetical protein